MFSPRIINSPRYLQMTHSAQCLYFHLCMNADDDGVVSTYPVTQMLATSDDDMRSLISRNLIKFINDEGVAVVTDWQEHNVIRADRKIDSEYKDLLIVAAPEIQLVESRERSDTKTKTKRRENWTSTDTPKQHPSSEDDVRLTDLLIELIKKNNPDWNLKGNKDTWVSNINKLHRIDGRTYQQIEYMIKWTQSDPFWRANILSTAKLREKFNDLIPKLKASVEKMIAERQKATKPKLV